MLGTRPKQERRDDTEIAPSSTCPGIHGKWVGRLPHGSLKVAPWFNMSACPRHIHCREIPLGSVWRCVVVQSHVSTPDTNPDGHVKRADWPGPQPRARENRKRLTLRVKWTLARALVSPPEVFPHQAGHRLHAAVQANSVFSLDQSRSLLCKGPVSF